MLKLKRIIFIFPIFVLVLTSVLFSAQPSGAKDLSWSRANIPSNGQAGKWVLAAGSDINHLTQAPDGTLYCTANPSDTEYRLFKSADSGYSWSYCGKVKDEITDITVLPDNSSFVFYATSTQVFVSSDAAYSFTPVSNPPPGGNGLEITSLDMASDNGSTCLLISTRNTLSGEFGGIYLLEQGQSPVWTDLGIGSRDVYRAAFSPYYASDKQIIAVSCDEKDTFISTGGNNTGWNQSISEARLDNVTLESAHVAFPEDYDSDPDNDNCTLFIALDTGQGKGGVFKLEGIAPPSGSTLTSLNIVIAGEHRDMSSLAVSGQGSEAYLMAGSADSNDIYFSADCGNSWTCSGKPPSGGSNVQVLMPADFTETGLAFAATSGTESAFSISRDKGENWDQIGLIDTVISRILDLAVSPEYAVDGTLFLLTADTLNSLWLSANSGTTWERVFTSSPSDRVKLVKLSPQFGSNQKVFLAGDSNPDPVIWKSDNSGYNFSKIPAVDNGTPVNIDTWAITPDDTLFLGSFDGNKGLVYTFDGTNFTDVSEAGTVPLNSIVVSPDYSHDRMVLAGNTQGSIYYSTTGGYLFEPLPMNALTPTFSGNVTAAFDPDFKNNQTLYAADDSPDKGIYRFIFGESASWERIDLTLPSGSRIKQVLTGSSGILYGLNSQEVDSSCKGGIERCLDPADTGQRVFETIIVGLDTGVSLQNCWIEDNILWAIDAVGSGIWTFTDTLETRVNLLSPQDGVSGLVTKYVTISWETLEGASSYEWQVDLYPEFIDPEDKFTDSCQVTSHKLPALDYDTTYYWRVRANGPILSNWSETRSFKTLKKPSSSGGGSSGGSGSRSTTSTPTPSPTHSPSPTPIPTPSPTPAASTITASAKTADSTTIVSVSPTPPDTSVITTARPLPAETTPPPPDENDSDSLDSLIRLVAILVGGLIVLSIILLIVVIAVMKKFKTRY